MKKEIYLFPQKKEINLLINKYGTKLHVYVKLKAKKGFWVLLNRTANIKNIEYIYVPSQIEQLTQTMSKLRSLKGCPWDKLQTHNTLLPYLLEEANEYCDAVVSQDMNKVLEELGDLLLQIVFHSEIAREEGYFDLEKCAKRINDKLIFRHPHVFQNRDKNIGKEEVEKIWQQQKSKEKMKPSSYSALPVILRIEKNIDMLKKQNKLQILDNNNNTNNEFFVDIVKQISLTNYGDILLEIIKQGKKKGYNTTYELLKSVKKWEKNLQQDN